MTTALLTGFEPFGPDETNPSGDAVRMIGSSWADRERLVTDILPVTFQGSAEAIVREIAAAGVRMRLSPMRYGSMQARHGAARHGAARHAAVRLGTGRLSARLSPSARPTVSSRPSRRRSDSPRR